jgi:hypothetical protein
MVKQAKRLLWKDPSLHFMEDYTRRVFWTFETVEASSTVRGSFQYAELTYLKDPQRSYML